jgi:hypothetical protein
MNAKYISMKKKYFLLIVFAVAILFNLYYMLSNQHLIAMVEQLEHKNAEQERVILNQQTYNEELISHMQLYRLMSEFRIDLNTKVRLEDGTTKCIKDISSNTMQLVFRFNEFTCQNCIFEEFSKLDSISNIIGKERIIVMGAYESDKDLNIVKRLNRVKLPIYNVKIGDINCPIDNYNVPYIFILDKNYNAKNIFIPLKGSDNQSDEYYRTIVNLFQNTDKDL